MLVKGQLAYIYLMDLERTIVNLKSLLPSRFGHVEEVTDYSYNNTIIKSYKVRTNTNTTFDINGLQGFKVCDMKSLETAIDNVKDKLSVDEYERIQNLLKLYQK